MRKIPATFENLLELLKPLNIRAYNGRLMISWEGKTKPFEDVDYTRIQFLAENEDFAPVSKTKIKGCIQLILADE